MTSLIVNREVAVSCRVNQGQPTIYSLSVQLAADDDDANANDEADSNNNKKAQLTQREARDSLGI